MKDDSFPDDLTGETLRSLYARGDDLTAERPIDFMVVFKSRDSAIAFAVHFIGLHYTCMLLDEKIDDCFPLVVTKMMLPTYRAINDFGIELEHVAEPLGGTNKRWGCYAVFEPRPASDSLGRRMRLAWLTLSGRSVRRGPLSF
jgi:hypothetical protein